MRSMGVQLQINPFINRSGEFLFRQFSDKRRST